MTGSLLAIVLIPVVTAILLAIWLTAVFHADRHPSTRYAPADHKEAEDTEPVTADVGTPRRNQAV